MHELSLAQSMVDTLEGVARTHNARRVQVATLELGELTCVEEETLAFAFEVACHGTLLEGCRLEIVKVPMEVRCDGCGWTGRGHTDQLQSCPECGGETFEVVAGREIQLKTIEIDDGE